MKIVAISDTHAKWKDLKIPECDVLVSAGDYSFKGERHLVKNFHEWGQKQIRDGKCKHFISVQGNHETWVEKNFQEAKELAQSVCPTVHFIDEGLVEIDGVKFWCSAIQPWFYNWAWNRHRGAEIKRHWDLIPDGIDVLVTHGPPMYVLDQLVRADGTPSGQHVGCQDLMEAVKRIKPSVHIFGHIHCGYGEAHIDGTSFYNAAICDEMYMPTNAPHLIEL